MKPRRIIDSIFFFLYIIVNFFVTVGEVVAYPFIIFYRQLKKLIKFVIDLLPKPKPLQLYSWRKKSDKFIPLLISLLAKIVYFTVKKITKTILLIWKIIIKPFRLISLKTRYFLLGFFVCLVAVFLLNIYQFVIKLPSPTNIGKVNYPLSTHLYDRTGKLLYEIYREQNRTPIKLSQLPTYVTQATIAIEDKEFYRHSGISLGSGILRAIKEIILNHKLQGGSTITQQLVKTSLLTPERTIERKIKEIILALWSERLYTKNQILEMYLNQVPYGGSAYGIEEAAKIYYNKSAKNLKLDEAAFLAGLPQSPSIYSPYSDPKLALLRRNEVLQAMWEQNYITKEEKNKATKIELKVMAPKTTIQAPHFVFYLKNELEKQYGIRKVEEGGLRVISSLNLNLQNQVEDILREELEKISYLNVSNGGILITKPSTGEILTMVGSVDYFDLPSGAYNVTTALRQPGSSIKPVMYSLALQKKFTAASIIDDSPITFNIPGSKPYRPINYDGRFHGRVNLRYALANSYNIPAVKVLNTIGVEEFIDFAKKFGISTWIDPSNYGLSLTLGGGEVKMVDMATAFGVFANQGQRVDLNGVIKIDDYLDNHLYESTIDKKRVVDEGVAFIISNILSDNIARASAFGSHSYLEIPGYKVAVKTGTTDNKKDNWTIGYTPEFLVVVWVGNNDNAPMNPYLASGVTGAAPIWNRIMTLLLKKYSANQSWFTRPEDIVVRKCFFGRDEYFIKGTEVNVNCQPSLLGPSITPTPQPSH